MIGKINQIEEIGIILSLVYSTWAIGQFFDRNKMSCFKGFLSYSFGVFSGLIILFILEQDSKNCYNKSS